MPNRHEKFAKSEQSEDKKGEKGVSSYGYDIRVANEFMTFTNIHSAVVDPKSMVEFKGDICVIPPNSFRTGALGRILSCPVAICLGKPTYARCGTIVNVTPSSRNGKTLSPSKSLTPPNSPPRFTPTKAWHKSSSLKRPKNIKPPTPKKSKYQGRQSIVLPKL